MPLPAATHEGGVSPTDNLICHEVSRAAKDSTFATCAWPFARVKLESEADFPLVRGRFFDTLDDEHFRRSRL
jgi:hypothetical protein